MCVETINDTMGNLCGNEEPSHAVTDRLLLNEANEVNENRKCSNVDSQVTVLKCNRLGSFFAFNYFFKILD